nr:MAG TPA: tail collar fiber protein [Caudoviricetes sp.]
MAEIFGYPIMGGGGSGGTLTVTGVAGSTVTVSSADKSYTRTLDSTGKAIFKGLASGTWTVTMTDGTQTATKTVTIDADYETALTYAKIYGISRDITAASPQWSRTNDAVGMTATASIGTVAGSSDFSACYPWSGISRETLSTGDVMVKIPKFWYRRYRDDNTEHIEICEKPAAGYLLHPAFSHGGVVADFIYVGAYKTSSNNKSVSKATPTQTVTRPVSRTKAKAKGAGWGLLDISMLSAIQMLILVEFANNNVQSVIGRGYCDGNSSVLNTGTCDNVAGLTGRPAGTDGKVDAVWRGIEGFWGNIMEWVDGINCYNYNYYICNDPSKYAENTTTNYTKLSFSAAAGWAHAYITQTGLDDVNSHIMLPFAAGAGSETTFECDTTQIGDGYRSANHGGMWSNGSRSGLFNFYANEEPTVAYTNHGSRLMYIPV